MTPADLVEIELIKRLKYRYCRALDLKRWDELGECLTEDCRSAYGDGHFSFDVETAIRLARPLEPLDLKGLRIRSRS